MLMLIGPEIGLRHGPMTRREHFPAWESKLPTLIALFVGFQDAVTCGTQYYGSRVDCHVYHSP